MSIIMPDGSHYFDETNADELLALYDGGGHARGLLPRFEHPRCSAYGSVPGLIKFEDSGIQRVPESEWKERIEWAWANEMWPMCFVRPPQKPRNQRQTNYCWGNGPLNAQDLVRIMVHMSYVETSAASICGPVTGYRNVGGWAVDALKYIAEHGACSVDLWPNDAIDRRLDNEASREDRKNHKLAEWIDLPDFEALVSSMLPPHLLPCPVGYNRLSHELCGVALKWVNGRLAGVVKHSWGDYGYANKYGVGGFEDFGGSLFKADDMQAVRIVTPGGR